MRPPPTKKKAIVNNEEGIYQPKTDETHAAYDEFLNLIRQLLAGQSLPIPRFAADKIIEILKNDTGYKHQENKKKHIDFLLNPISDHVFDQLLSISKLLTDFHDANVSSSHGNEPIPLQQGAGGVNTTTV